MTRHCQKQPDHPTILHALDGLQRQPRTRASRLVGCRRAESPRTARSRDRHVMSKRLGHLVYRIAGLTAAVALGLAVYVAIIDGTTNNKLPISLLAGGGV